MINTSVYHLKPDVFMNKKYGHCIYQHRYNVSCANTRKSLQIIHHAKCKRKKFARLSTYFFTTLLICSIYSLKYPSYLQHCKQLIFKYNSTLVLYYEIKESKRYLWRTILRTFVDNHKAMKLYLIMFMLFNIIYCTDGAAVVKFMIIVRTPMDDIYVFSSIEMYR